MTVNVEKCELGQSFDDFLKEQGLYEFIKMQVLATLIVDLNFENLELSQDFSQVIEMIAASHQEPEFVKYIVHFVDSPNSELKYARFE